MWSFHNPLPPATVRLDGACAAEGGFLCWSFRDFFSWSPVEKWRVLPPLESRPIIVRSTGRGVLVISEPASLPGHRVSFWRPGTSDWAWHGKIPRVAGKLEVPCAAMYVATGGTLLAICDCASPGRPIRVFLLDETRLVPLGLAYGDVSGESFFVGGLADEDGTLLAMSHARAFRLRVDAHGLTLDTLWEVASPHLRPALDPVVASGLVLFPVRGNSPPRVFDLRTGEVPNPGLPTVAGADVLWTTWAAGDPARTVRLLDDLQSVPRPVPEAQPLAFYETSDGCLAVATSRGVGTCPPSPRPDDTLPRSSGSLFSAEGLLHWRNAHDAWRRLGALFVTPGSEEEPSPDVCEVLARNGADLARRILANTRSFEDDPATPLPMEYREALRLLDRGPDAIAVSAEVRQALSSDDPHLLVAAFRVAAAIPYSIHRFFRPGADPGPAVLARGLASVRSRAVLAALQVGCSPYFSTEGFEEELRGTLASADPLVRQRALERIERSDLQQASFRGLLLERLRCDPDGEVRRIALDKIEPSRGGWTADELVEAISDPSAAVRAAASGVIRDLQWEEWKRALPGAFDRLLLAILSGLDPPPSAGNEPSVVELLRPGLPREEFPENEYDDDDDEPYLAGDLEATLYRLFYTVGLGLPIESSDLEKAVRLALEDEGDTGCEGKLTGCHIETFRGSPSPHDALASALAIARRRPSVGRRCVLLACAGIAKAAPDGSRPEHRPEGRTGGGALHERLRTAGRGASLGLAMDLLRREARGGDSFSLLALWFLASHGEPGAFEELRRRLPAACAKWRTLVFAWARLAPDTEMRSAGIREVLLSPAVPAAYRLQIQAELLPDPFFDGHGPELLPYFEAVARDATIPFNERREAALHSRSAGNSRPLVDLWSGQTTRPPGDFPDDAREGDLAASAAATTTPPPARQR